MFNFKERPILSTILLFFCLSFIGVGVKLCSAPAAMVSGAMDVAQKEFNPQRMLEKYEWFKDASFAILEKKASYEALNNRITQMEEGYGDTPMKDWDRWDKQQLNTWRNEAAGVKLIYNKLVAEYNAQSNKFNWEHFDATDGDVLARNFDTL